MRLYREHSSETKQKISESMKSYHRALSPAKAQKIAFKRAKSLRAYWKTVPTREEYEAKLLEDKSNFKMRDMPNVSLNKKTEN